MAGILFLGLVFAALAQTIQGCPKIVCYTTNWSQYRPGSGKFFPENIDPSLCTHIIYAFARLTGNNLGAFEWNDDNTEWSVGLYQRFANLKNSNPNLKTLLAVGGWNLGSEPFTQIVQSPSNRQAFITQSIQFLRDRNFDGLDLDWEYPANRGSPPEDRDYYTTLVREMKQAFEQESRSTGKPRLLLTAAVGAGKPVIDTAYDIPAITREFDFISLMAYDLHGSWETYTGHHSPLYPRSDETGDDRYLNVDFAAQYWLQKGAPREKLIIGVPTYGRSFTLASADNNGVGAPAPQAGKAGEYTREAGFLSYYEICALQAKGATRHFIEEQRVPYLHSGDLWVGYDDADSLREKVRYIKHHQFGGVMIWDLPLDDFTGTFCGQGPFPLIHAINDECQHTTGELHTAAPASQVIRTTTHLPTTAHNPIATHPPDVTHGPDTVTQGTASGTFSNCWGRPDGFYASPTSCVEYFICVNYYSYSVTCASGLVFSPYVNNCDWPTNYECLLGDAPKVTTTTTGLPPTTHWQAPQDTTPSHTLSPGFTGTPNDICRIFGNGVFANPTDSGSYYECSNGQWFAVACPIGCLFNPHSHSYTCDLCSSEQPPDLQTQAPVTTQAPVITQAPVTTQAPVITQAPINTQAPVITQAPVTTQAPVITQAPITTQAPFITQTPVYTQAPADTTAPAVPNTDKPAMTAGEINNFCINRSNGIYEDPWDCTFFLNCNNGLTFRGACASGMVFNTLIKDCDWPSAFPSCAYNYN